MGFYFLLMNTTARQMLGDTEFGPRFRFLNMVSENMIVWDQPVRASKNVVKVSGAKSLTSPKFMFIVRRRPPVAMIIMREAKEVIRR